METLVARYDCATFELPGGRARVRLAVAGGGAWDALLEHGSAYIVCAGSDPDATLTADPATSAAIADDVGSDMRAFQEGRLAVRRDLNVGGGFLAATSGLSGPGRLRFRTVVTRRARLSTMQAGNGPPVLAIHGLGGTKVPARAPLDLTATRRGGRPRRSTAILPDGAWILFVRTRVVPGDQSAIYAHTTEPVTSQRFLTLPERSALCELTPPSWGAVCGETPSRAAASRHLLLWEALVSRLCRLACRRRPAGLVG